MPGFQTFLEIFASLRIGKISNQQPKGKNVFHGNLFVFLIKLTC